MGRRVRWTAALLAPFAVSLGAGWATAQHMNAQDGPCRGPNTTAGEAACFSAEQVAHEKDLTTLLVAIRRVLNGSELDLLEQSQTAWLQYRRLSCEAEYALYEGGTAGPVARLACMEALTRSRLKQLHDAYDWRLQKRR